MAAKRKHSGSMSLRSTKHIRKDDAALPNDQAASPGFEYEDDIDADENDADSDVDSEASGMANGMALSALRGADSPEWQETIERVVKAAVSIHFCQTASFDTDPSMSSQATGFVVDKERGYILTNRHVVCAGPFWGYVIFDNHEEAGFSLVVREQVLTSPV